MYFFLPYLIIFRDQSFFDSNHLFIIFIHLFFIFFFPIVLCSSIIVFLTQHLNFIIKVATIFLLLIINFMFPQLYILLNPTTVNNRALKNSNNLFIFTNLHLGILNLGTFIQNILFIHLYLLIHLFISLIHFQVLYFAILNFFYKNNL